MRTLLVILSLPLLWLGCAATQKGGASGAVDLFTEDAKVVAVQMDAVTFSFPYELANKTASDVTLLKVASSTSITGEETAQKTEEPNVVVRAGQSFTGALEVTVPLSTSDEVLTARETAGPASFGQTATFTLRDASGTAEYQAEWNGELFLPRRPKVSAAAQAVRYENNLELHFTMGIKNPNAFVVPVEGLSYVITIDGVEIERGTVAERQKLQPSSELVFDITRAVGREDLVELARKLLPQTSISYDIEATLRAAGQTQREPLSGSIDFARSY